MALYEITLTGRYLEQTTINRWTYEMTGTPAVVSGSFGLVSAFGAIDSAGVYPSATVLSSIRQLVNEAWTATGIQAFNIYNDSDFYSTGFVGTVNGDRSAEPMPPFNAFGFRSNRTTRAIRRATKRFAGVNEDDVTNGNSFGAGASTNLDVLGVAMSDSLVYTDEGNDLTYAPCVLAKEKYTVPESGNEAYRYYATEVEQLDHIMRSIIWEKYTNVRSQNSRQFGHGI